MLMDIGYQGCFWSFEEKKFWGANFTRVRLDRALASANWMVHFPLAVLSHLTSVTSDHGPIFLQSLGDQPHGRVKKNFCYETMWETHETWQNSITTSWNEVQPGARLEDIHKKLSVLSEDLESWSHNTFGSVRKEIKWLKSELESLRNDPQRTRLSHLEIKLNDQLVEMYHREELMWRQSARIEWLSAGDKNTKFFHMRASLRRKKNMIKAFSNALGIQVDDPSDLKVVGFLQTSIHIERCSGCRCGVSTCAM